MQVIFWLFERDRKKPAPDLIRGGSAVSEKIMPACCVVDFCLSRDAINCFLVRAKRRKGRAMMLLF